MYMEDAEILNKYNKADNKSEMCQILADLNGCSKEMMKDFLVEKGVPESDFVKKKRTRKKTVGQDESESIQNIETHLPEPVRNAILFRIEYLDRGLEEIKEERDFLSDFMEGKAQNEAD